MAERDELLKLLEANGKHFFQSFDLSTSSSSKRKTTTTSNPLLSKKQKIEHHSGSESEEWGGIQSSLSDSTSSKTESENEGDDFDVESGSEFEQEDDDFTGGSSAIKDDKIVVFSAPSYTSRKPDPVSKAQMKAFMSSKVSRLRDNGPGVVETKKKSTEEEIDEKTNAENDALLHKLVHTQLLTGSLNPELGMTPAHMRKALAGRVLELAGTAKLGKGEKTVREAEKTKASKRVREGLNRKQRETEQRQLEEAKNFGNYHPALKKLFEPSGAKTTVRSRSRGLKMGVGKFRGGVLQLSREEIASASGESRHTKLNRGRKRT